MMFETAVVPAPEAQRRHGTEYPTIVILASIGFTVRNYLLGECLAHLQKESRPVVLTPLSAQPDFRRTMSRRGAEVMALPYPTLDSSWNRLRRWREALHTTRNDNETWRLKRSPRHHEASWKAFAWNRFTTEIARTLASQRNLRRLDSMEAARALRSPEADYYRGIFNEKRPALVFSPAPLMPDEWLPIQVARAMGIPTALAVLSWDNLSSKSRLPLPCSAVLVWSEAMRREFLNYYPEMRPERVRITGVPQFDFYFQNKYRESREDFIKRLGGDPSRPLIVYAGVTPGLMPNEPRIIENLMEALRRGAVRGEPHLLVRLHPKDDGSRYREFRARFPETLFTATGERHQGQLKSWQPDDEEVRALVNTMWHGDVHINVASTMTIDAAVVDRPVINVMYDLHAPGERRPWGMYIYECTHYLPIPQTGGVQMARKPEELVEHINRYLEEPARDHEGRRRLAELVCGTVDGRAGERTAAQLLKLAYS